MPAVQLPPYLRDADALVARFPALMPVLLWARSPRFATQTRSAARFLVVLYFFNFAVTWMQYAYYGYYGDWYLGPFWALVTLLGVLMAGLGTIGSHGKQLGGAAGAASASAGFWGKLSARCVRFEPLKLPAFGLLFALSLREMLNVFYTQFVMMLTHGHHLFINELLVKKLAVCASAALMLAEDPQFRARIQGSLGRFSGGVISLEDIDFDQTSAASPGARTKQPGQQQPEHSKKRSVFLLAVRVMIGLLFLYVGFYEVRLQLQRWSGWISHDGHAHAASEEDGHNQMWAKVSQFAMALPLVIGYKTRGVSVWISCVCILESFVQWRFWSTNFGIGYSIHARDHFVVNLAVAGGLWLLASLGAGKYSVDAMLKKKE